MRQANYWTLEKNDHYTDINKDTKNVITIWKLGNVVEGVEEYEIDWTNIKILRHERNKGKRGITKGIYVKNNADITLRWSPQFTTLLWHAYIKKLVPTSIDNTH